MRFARKLSPRLLWDVFMVWVALVNLWLIGFDLSYLLLRPHYFRYAPVVTRVYDPVKGIVPHPLTSELADEADVTSQLYNLDPRSSRLDKNVAQLELLTRRVLVENPFERSGQTRNLEVIRLVIARETGRSSAALKLPGPVTKAAAEFWSQDRELLGHRLEVFETKIRPLLRVNYFREFDLAGRLEDNFWMIDLPFLVLFWIEFVVRWFVAIRRKTHARWYFFPIFNWYDVLGLIPNAYFRVFRLLRAVSMYMRLRRSELSRMGSDFASRTVAYVSNIITEEISDMVSLRILNEYQEEIRNGTHLRIIEATVGKRIREIERVAAIQIREIFTDRETLEKIGDLLRLNLDKAVEESEALQSVPLPSPLVRPVVRSIGGIILEITLESISTTMESEEGQRTVEELVSSVAEQISTGPGLAEIEATSKEITLDVLEHMKEQVAVKKWALPDAGQTRQAIFGESDEPSEDGDDGINQA